MATTDCGNDGVVNFKLESAATGCECIDMPHPWPCPSGDLLYISKPKKGSKVLCVCLDGYVASPACRAPGLQQVHIKAKEPPGCECIRKNEFALEEKIPVDVAALQFCEATVDAARFQLLDSGYEHDHIPGAVQKSIAYTHAWLKQMLPVHVCQQALSASKVSITDSSSLGFGRMAPLVAKANSADRNAWEHALTRVCHDECEQLVRETLENFHDIAMKDPEKGISFTRSCASKVVQKVEAETLGCCSRVCGWNNVTCMSWPFLSPNQKIQWEAQCCSEWNVLKGSSRQRMCDSVLSPADAAKVSKNDVTEPPDVDTDAVIVGQDSFLFWTDAGVKSDLAKDYASMDGPPQVGEPVDMLILMHQKHLRKKGLDQGWFEEKIPGDESLLQMGEGSCEPPPDMVSCTETFKKWYRSTCTQETGWNYKNKAHNQALKCKFSMPAEIEKTPLACKKKFGKEKRVANYFEFKPDDQNVVCQKVESCKFLDKNHFAKIGDKEGAEERMNFEQIGFWHFVP